MKFDRCARALALRRTALAVAIVAGVSVTGQVFAQATTGTIFGSAPTSGATVQVTGGSGFNRTVPVDSTGHYSVTVPVGDYTVSLVQNGAVVQSHDHINPAAGGASEADFVQRGEANAKSLSTVTVTASALPAIDVSSTTQNLTITAKQLTELPVARNSGSIALLAPGTVSGAAKLGGGPTGEPVISFNGSSIVENAYYINGFNTSDPLSNTGGITLPYGSIDQQQTLTSGYGAMYGRSAGGVISQVGKSGTNEWHFGAQAIWQPAFAKSSTENYYWANPNNVYAWQQPGQIYEYRRGNSSWNTVYDAYVGGPLIEDTLFMFLSYEANKSQGHSVDAYTPNVTNYMYYWKNSDPKIYGKLDWNINASNSVSITGIRNQAANDPSATYTYDYATHTQGALSSLGQRDKTTFDLWILKYTSYITDNLTLNATYGKMDGSYFYYQPVASDAARIGQSLPSTYSVTWENPAYLPSPGQFLFNPYGTGAPNNPKHTSEVRNLRLDLDWKLGDHDILFGIDNDTDTDKNDGNGFGGPGYAWTYGVQTPGVNIQSLNGYTVGPGTPCTIAGNAYGCYVAKNVYTTEATVSVVQRAQYLQDNWQVTPNLLLNIGLRNDQFTNYTPNGVPYLRLTKPQWAPRLGFSWDVFGDSSMKVFGNAGRYYLAMPTSVALREASNPLYTNQYFSYTGINPNGVPQGLQLIPTTFPNGVYYVNGENGTTVDPRLVSSQNLKAEYVDQFVLGMQQQFNLLEQSWVYGVSGTVNRMGRAIDDWYGSESENLGIIQKAAAAQGVTVDPNGVLGSILINPGVANTLTIPNGSGGYSEVKIPWADFHMPQLKRRYYALDMYLEHPFDGRWWGKIDYTFSRSYGDYEGPVASAIGQGGSSQSATIQWDFPEIMSYANGLQANNQRHQLRLYGSYQISPEWSAGGTYRIASGTPLSCYGFYGPNQTDPGGYGGSYHWCNGIPSPPGATGNTPWTHQLNLQVDYRPAFAGHKLDFQLQVHNVFNEQKSIQQQSSYNGNTPAQPYPYYLMPYSTEAPRYVQLGVTYDY
ncbi:TonB-dependent receptor [Dyella agri]|uniref:TonB-dependent receptor n=1 Tax=Dyella agri TaxID=1926869 RepID=A0ABW8KDU9_9GAMM